MNPEGKSFKKFAYCLGIQGNTLSCLPSYVYVISDCQDSNTYSKLAKKQYNRLGLTT
jgi:hypothetical protein